MEICQKKEVLGFDDKWLIIIGIPLVSLVMPLMIIPFGDPLTPEWYKTNVLISFVQVPVYWFFFRRVFVEARRRFPAFRNTWKRMIFQFAIVIFLYLLLEPLLSKLCQSVILGQEGFVGGISITVSTIVMIFLWVAVYEGIYFYGQLKKSILEKEQLQRENIQSQLEGLKSQVNPHFLFNSLNTLACLIPEDAEKSVKFVQQLSKVYRYILEISDEKLIPLRQELAFLDAYIFLLKERFEDNLQVEIDIPESRMKDQIIPLSLQILFENAIKHNIISSSKPLKVEVRIGTDNKLTVENNLQKKKQIKNTTRFGLDNIRNRYRFLSDEAVEVISTSTSFIVSLPLIRISQ